MIITKLKVNHIEKPIGYMFRSQPRISWKVEQTAAKVQTGLQVEVSLSDDFADLIYDSGIIDYHETTYPLFIDLSPRTQYFFRVTVWGDNGEYATESSWFETGKMNEKWQGNWITPCCDSAVECPVVEKTFEIRNKIEKARVYICSAGLFELNMNGVRVGKEYLTPYCNTYSEWMQVITFDVKEQLKIGLNTLNVTLANGWYKGRFTFDDRTDIYGDKLGLICELHLKFSDGSTQIIASDESWHAHPSIFKSAEIYNGEVQDYTVSLNEKYPVTLLKIDKSLLRDRLSLPVIIKETRPAEKLIVTPKGEKCLDFGQNMVGWLRIKTDLPKGNSFKLSFFEVFDPDGNFYNDNLRTAKQEFCYMSDGNARELEAHFTYYGFRYVKIEGLDEICLDDFLGCVVYSDMDILGNVKTSNPDVNRLFLNALWGQKGNFVDTPTDCPQRNERLGWTGDAQVFCGTACYNMEATAFFRKYLYDLSREQKLEGGCVPLFIPTFSPSNKTFGGSSAWGDAATIIPWQVYLHSGDISILQEQYESMKSWVDYIHKQDDGSRLWNKGMHLGDWLALDNPNSNMRTGITPTEMIATSYYCYSANIVAKAAKVLGNEKDAANYSKLTEEIRAALRDNFVTKSGRIASDSQTSNVISLFMNFATDKEYSAKLLNEKVIIGAGGHLNTGFVGTAYLCRVLSENGYNDTAYRLLLSTDYPSWLYEVKKGATTIWERWNSIQPDGSLGDVSMNSYNHYAYGAVMEWMYRNVAGIKPSEEVPGFKEAIIAPQPNSRLEWVEVDVDTASGVYSSHWKITEQGLEFFFRIPFDCKAVLCLPDAPQKIAINGVLTAYMDQMVLDAGTYKIVYKPVVVYLEKYSFNTKLGTIFEKPALKAAVLEQFEGLRRVPFYILDSLWDLPLKQVLKMQRIDYTNHDEEMLMAKFKSVKPWHTVS